MRSDQTIARLPGLVVLMLAGAAGAWTPPLQLSNAPLDSEPSVPKIATGLSGRLLVVYQQKPEWRVYYRERSTTGHWGAIEVLGTDFCAGRPDVIEDASGRSHVVYPMRGAGATYDLMHSIRSGGTWSTAAIMSTGGTGDYEDYPRLARDSTGRIHLVYVRTPDSQPGSVAYRVWNGTAWSAETTLGSTSQAYYQRPDISIDASDRIHVVWIVNGGYRNIVQYRRYAGGAWSSTVTIGQSTPSGSSATFLAHARIAAATANNIIALWQEEASITYVFSTNGGTSWSSQQSLAAAGSSSLHAGNGLAHTAYMPSGATSVVYRYWNGTAWSGAQTITPPSSYWKGWPDLTDDNTGGIHVVYDDVVNGNNLHQISYVNSGADTIPPGPVTAFAASGRSTAVRLVWTNPTDPDFTGTLIRYKTTGYPTGPADGIWLCDRATAPGSMDSFDHTDLPNGTVFYYAAFAHDGNGNYAAGVTVSARPAGTTDYDRDSDVDLADFAFFQMCFNGPNIPPALDTCRPADFDEDGDVDLMDFAALQSCFNGPNRPKADGCVGN